ncbi:hypothetical protein G6F32_015783 [Rhizopus arrhizus]|nr:hypothetical protein G6F32_015783 [Rhizopus arrhizus]
MSKPLQGEIALVTGASRGIGAAIADLQRAAAIDGGAPGVGIAAGQGKRAGTALHQAAGATEHTAERGVAVVAAGAQGCATQQHAGPVSRYRPG